MKVEEIKLAFENNQKFELTMYSDIEAILDKGFKSIDEYNSLQKQSDEKQKTALSSADEAIKMATKAINLGKELGIPIETFNSQLSLAKNLNARSSKAKSTVV